MADPSFGTGWPTGNPNIVTLVRADGLRLPIHRELKDMYAILMDLTEMMGYDILPGQTWGYANRPISGTDEPSNHSWGTADDKNAPSNPYASADWHRRNARGTKPFGLQLVCDIPENVIRLWEAHGFRWGGRYTTKPDPMHFEFMGTVDQARAYTRKLKLYLSSGQPVPTQPPDEEITVAKKEDRPMLVIRKANKEHQLLLLNGATIVAHKPLAQPTATTTTMEVDDVMWNYLINVAKYTKTFLDPRPQR